MRKTNNLENLMRSLEKADSMEDIWMANKHTIKCSISFTIKEMQVKITKRYHHHTTEWTKWQTIIIPRYYPCGSAGKESACSARDLSSIPGLGRSPGEGKGYPLPYSGLESPVDYSPLGCKESDMTERLIWSEWDTEIKALEADLLWWNTAPGLTQEWS